LIHISKKVSAISTPAQLGLRSIESRSTQTLPLVAFKLGDVHLSSVSPTARLQGTTKAPSESALDSGLARIAAAKSRDIEKSPSGNSSSEDIDLPDEQASAPAHYTTSIIAHDVPESNEFEAMWKQLPLLEGRLLEQPKLALLWVNRRRNILSNQMKQICEDGKAFYEFALSLRPASVVDAEEFRDKWNVLHPATTNCINTLLEFERLAVQ
jgi:hypothetical protein